MKRARTDRVTAAAVSRGLAASRLGDVRKGVKVMTERRVPPDVITRVFLAPQRRRATDWKR